jgi:hypothetical protein
MGYSQIDELTHGATGQQPDRRAVTSGSWLELLYGAAVLAIVAAGMAGYHPGYAAVLGTIVVGFGIVAHAGTMAAQATQPDGGDELAGIGADLIAGLASVALGVLVLVRLLPPIFLAIAAMVLGTALLFAPEAQPGRASAAADAARILKTRMLTTLMILSGLAALVIGVLAFALVAPVLPLSLIAIACVASGLVIAAVGNLTSRAPSRA